MAQQGRRRHVSITDVAAQAGVSITTVSHVLSGQRPVSAATTAKVRQVIAELGYEPNQLARGLRLQRTNTVALVIPDITNPFYPLIARGLQNVLGPAGMQVLVTSTDADPAAEDAAVQQMITRRVDGLAFAGYQADHRRVTAAAEVGIPVVLLGGRTARPGIDVVSADDVAGGEIATEYLITRAYRRIAFITGAERVGSPANRVLGYRHALRAAGMPYSARLVVREEISRDGGARAMARLLSLRQAPDAVLCTNDVTALGALDAAKDAGLRVPRDVAVMGFDDIEIAALTTPALTTVSIRPLEQGEAIGRLLLGRLDGSAPRAAQRILFDPAVVPRESA
ncbi:LacI family DNA-binding transcriptional regulator [Catenulispora sp. NF23]|uniref:LacI family DNA-binding transcriptional regulator n=1 Tax=Catenulispora pinistramenti TaxID=2705254 RepID=A0ABS5L095_9ACTN|nr:LacI family DNA-binding transcriptional regulator [Catenulispora pinistramenti]MBS2535164.1 LacI family DNA-binding transcriptional regulator [Catenulispora pinistramenti]MBS2551758.1 LacI family DNA-binding transcriptional regulator [Catenulispora pinistramenti]